MPGTNLLLQPCMHSEPRFGTGSGQRLACHLSADVAACSPAHPVLLQLCVNIGITLAYLVGIPYDHTAASIHLGSNHVAWWRFMFGLGMLLAACQVARFDIATNYTSSMVQSSLLPLSHAASSKDKCSLSSCVCMHTGEHVWLSILGSTLWLRNVGQLGCIRL